jgi:hypothetical protein
MVNKTCFIYERVEEDQRTDLLFKQVEWDKKHAKYRQNTPLEIKSVKKDEWKKF